MDNVYYPGTPEKKPPPDPDPEPIAVKRNSEEIQALQQKLEAEKEISREKLHEATSAAKLTVNQHMLDTIAERVKVERLKVALNASTDEIRRGRAAQSFNEQLTTELKETRQTANSSKMEADRLNTEKRDFLEQQMTNEMEKAKRSKRNDEELVEANTSKPPSASLCRRR